MGFFSETSVKWIAAPLLAIFMSSCINFRIEGQPNPTPLPPDIESTILIPKDTKYKNPYDQINSLEKLIENLFEKAERPENVYYIYPSVEEPVPGLKLKNSIAETKSAVMSFIANSQLNPNGRFTYQAFNLIETLSDAEKAMGDQFESSKNLALDMSEAAALIKLHDTCRAMRSDISNFINSKNLETKPGAELE